MFRGDKNLIIDYFKEIQKLQRLEKYCTYPKKKKNWRLIKTKIINLENKNGETCFIFSQNCK